MQAPSYYAYTDQMYISKPVAYLPDACAIPIYLVAVYLSVNMDL